MTFLFCTSYMNIPHVICMINQCDEQFRIFTSDKNIFKFFSKLFKKKVIFLENQNLSIRSPVLLLKTILSLPKTKKKLIQFNL